RDPSAFARLLFTTPCVFAQISLHWLSSPRAVFPEEALTMWRNILVRFTLALAASGLVALTRRAQDPAEILDPYRLLPRYSTLHQTGGIAGLDERYRLIGKYDL